MPILPRHWSDQRTEEIISLLLRVGVTLSAAIVLLGGLYYLARHGAEMPNYRIFHGEPYELRTVNGILQYVGSLHARGVIQLGLLLLILTPIARVIFSVWAFLVERDRLYVVITLVVLAILLYNLIHG
jgi:uncharacterized membrane protein